MENRSHARRRFLKVGVMSASATMLGIQARAAGPQQAHATGTEEVQVRYDELLPHEFRKRLEEQPIAYLPLGTIEWHGDHLPLGSDAIQAEGLMVQCAREMGGIVMPPIHLGPDRSKPDEQGNMLIGMDYAKSTNPPRQLDGSCYWVPPELHLALIDAILTQLKRAGFQAVFADGHGPSRWSWVEHISEREARFGLKLFGVSKEIRGQWKSQVDHAARNETSLMMHFRPDSVDLTQLPAARDVWPQGVGGEDPRDATREHGIECLKTSVGLVRKLFTEAGLL
jgi:creatinine amidohydrolase